MNEFEYIIAKDKLSNMKTLKAKEALIRDCHSKLKHFIRYSYQFSASSVPPDMPEYYIFKIYLKALNSYTGKHLPSFLTDDCSQIGVYLFNHILEDSQDASLINWLMKDSAELVSLRVNYRGSRSSSDVELLSETFRDELPICHINYYVYSHDVDSPMLTSSQAQYLALLRLRRSLGYTSVFLEREIAANRVSTLDDYALGIADLQSVYDYASAYEDSHDFI